MSSTGQKIIRGLKEALRYSRCRHEYTVWESTPRTPYPKWFRTCTKCKATEVVFAEHEPEM